MQYLSILALFLLAILYSGNWSFYAVPTWILFFIVLFFSIRKNKIFIEIKKNLIPPKFKLNNPILSQRINFFLLKELKIDFQPSFVYIINPIFFLFTCTNNKNSVKTLEKQIQKMLSNPIAKDKFEKLYQLLLSKEFNKFDHQEQINELVSLSNHLDTFFEEYLFDLTFTVNLKNLPEADPRTKSFGKHSSDSKSISDITMSVRDLNTKLEKISKKVDIFSTNTPNYLRLMNGSVSLSPVDKTMKQRAEFYNNNGDIDTHITGSNARLFKYLVLEDFGKNDVEKNKYQYQQMKSRNFI